MIVDKKKNLHASTNTPNKADDGREADDDNHKTM